MGDFITWPNINEKNICNVLSDYFVYQLTIGMRCEKNRQNQHQLINIDVLLNAIIWFISSDKYFIRKNTVGIRMTKSSNNLTA